ncbi:hypothetical protein E2C01_005539 [Portunus trituberculatus]|uniref:Uncharacterized protein n=1 Tax=Portunus trituberculatus TaxID=210409 RepID=A0A5B7CWW7_PORTR|nr:hypothetical protein [Portunus trituberculatus]
MKSDLFQRPPRRPQSAACVADCARVLTERPAGPEPRDLWKSGKFLYLNKATPHVMNVSADQPTAYYICTGSEKAGNLSCGLARFITPVRTQLKANRLFGWQPCLTSALAQPR